MEPAEPPKGGKATKGGILPVAHHESKHRTAIGLSSQSRRRDAGARFQNLSAVSARWRLAQAAQRLSAGDQVWLARWLATESAAYTAEKAEFGPSEAMCRANGGPKGAPRGTEPLVISADHWSIKGAQSLDEFACGSEMRRLKAAAECGSQPGPGEADLSSSELNALVGALSQNPRLRGGFARAFFVDGRDGAVQWLIDQAHVEADKTSDRRAM